MLVAHGSRDPAAVTAIRALGRAVASARPGLEVRTAYLEHSLPRPEQVLAALAGEGRAAPVVVPLLLTAAFHGRVDLPGVLAGAGGPPVVVTDVLGPVAGVVPRQLVAALLRRLAATRPGRLDAVVLAAAGTRYATARRTVTQAARAFGRELGLPCRVGYASAAGPTPAEAVTVLRREGARRVGVAAYFLAPGQLYRAAADPARAAGAVAVAAPLGATAELADLVLARIDRAVSRRSGRALSGQRKGPGEDSPGPHRWPARSERVGTDADAAVTLESAPFLFTHPAPHTGILSALERPAEALGGHGTALADRLGLLDL